MLLIQTEPGDGETGCKKAAFRGPATKKLLEFSLI